jgi:hypothetical protein
MRHSYIIKIPNERRQLMRDIAIAVWILALWPLLTATNCAAIVLALAGMVLSAWGAVKKGKEV